MGNRFTPGFIPGDPYVICDICGFKCRFSNSAMMYNNLRACDVCWNAQPINDLPPPIFKQEGQAFPDSRPEPTDKYIDSSKLPNFNLTTTFGIVKNNT